MARHRASIQALRNFFSILIGFVLGGLNNLVVLPWAFQDDLASWGLVRIAAAWATLLGPIIAFGGPAAMNRFKGRMSEQGKLPELFGSLLIPPLFLFFCFIALPTLLFPEGVADLLGLNGTDREAVRPIAWLSGLTAGQIYCAGFLSTRLKTAMSTFARETFFKFGYLALALALGMGWLGNAAFLPAFVGLYALVLLLLLAQSAANRLSLNWRGLQDRKTRIEVRKYAATMIVGTSAWVILGQLDIIMVGRLMGLEWVPAFTIAAFIAAVAQIPSRAVQRLVQPLISNSLHEQNPAEIWRVVQLTHRSMLLSGGWILACIWASTPEFDLLLPEPFHGLAPAIGCLGMMKVIQGASIGSAILVGQSDHYSKTVWINWLMILVAIPLNLWLIPESGMGWGLTGAALATLLSVGMATAIRQILVLRIWQMWIPDMRTLGIVCITALPGILLHLWQPEWHVFIALIAKSAAITLWTGGLSLRLNVAPEAVKLVTEKFPAIGR
jgi:O-antigen/teichoic acid export membrane protein